MRRPAYAPSTEHEGRVLIVEGAYECKPCRRMWARKWYSRPWFNDYSHRCKKCGCTRYPYSLFEQWEWRSAGDKRWQNK